MENLIRLLPLTRESRVLDAGCGKAELLIRLVETYGVHAVGVDWSGPFLDEARQQAWQRIPQGELELRESNIQDYAAASQSFDLAICLGSTHLYENFRGTLQKLGQAVRPGGLILLAEGYWKQTPDPEYLEALQAKPEDYTTHAGNVAVATEEGWTLLYGFVASDDDWDAYEGHYLFNAEQHVHEHPGDPDAAEILKRIRDWRDTYYKWGRDTLGFGLYLLRKPDSPAVVSV